LPQIEVFLNEKDDESVLEKDNTPLSTKSLLFDYVICNRAIWVMAIAYFFIYVIRIGINDWAMLYFVAKGYSKLKAASCIFWFEAGGFIGSLASGWVSDMTFRGKRNPVNAIFTLGAIGSLIGLHWNGIHSLFLDSLMIFLTGFFIFGPQMLIGMLAAELPDKRAAATASGFVGCFAYIGAAAAGGPLGALTQEWGWTGFFLTLIASGIISIGLIVSIWSLKRAAPQHSTDSFAIMQKNS
jgi:OPA family sugar phosphate sensor protein UhpC-like MFS transporter